MSFSAAAGPLADSVIATTAQGLSAGMVNIPVAGGSIPAYRAVPAGSGACPVLLVVQEIFGVHEHIRDVARRLAHAGYMAIAPELYWRQGDTAQLQTFPEIMRIVAQVPDAQVLADLDACLAWAVEQGGDGSRLGATGFCWGGRIVWLYAAHQPALKAGVAWYGRLSGTATDLQPRFPLDLAAALQAPVLGLYGGQDQSIPLDTVQQMQSALTDAGSHSRIHVYPDAPHAFFADYRAGYRPDAATDGWQRMLEWFRQYGMQGAA
jgi:carboxymethylenebutenolidase